MKPDNTLIAKSLIAFAWADGRVTEDEQAIVDAVLSGLDVDADSRAELREYAETPRTLDDLELEALVGEHRELLLANAAILVRADGDEALAENALLQELAQRLGFGADEAERILASSRDGALHLPRESLIPERPTAPPRRK